MEEKFDRVLIIGIIALAIFITGVQIGIHQGRKLQKQECYEYINAN